MSEMNVAPTVRAIRESLQIIQSTQDQADLESRRWHEKILREIKKIDRLVTRLELEITCPLEKDCPRLKGSNA